MIVLDSVSKRLGGSWVLHNVSLHVPRGEVLALVGPSGTGKSVLLKHIIGLVTPDAGDVKVDGESVAHADYRTLARLRRGMGYVFQDGALIDWLPIRENLLLAIPDALRRRDRDGVEERLLETLRLVNLPTSVLGKRPAELSGGMRKRAGVARATLNAPRIVLYDEPTTGLDPQNVHAINECILTVRRELGATSIVVTHDMSSVARIAERVAMLADGAIRFHGTVDEFFGSMDPAVVTFRGMAECNDQGEASWQTTRAVATN